MHHTYSHLIPIDTLRADRFIDDLRRHDYDSFIQRLRLILARSAPAHSARRFSEWHFQSIFAAISLLTGTETHVEFMTRGGRADCVLVTPWQTIIFEFKFNGDADKAVAQIQTRDYATAVLFPGREIVAIGINFASASRNISSWSVSILATPLRFKRPRLCPSNSLRSNYVSYPTQSIHVHYARPTPKSSVCTCKPIIGWQCDTRHVFWRFLTLLPRNATGDEDEICEINSGFG